MKVDFFEPLGPLQNIETKKINQINLNIDQNFLTLLDFFCSQSVEVVLKVQTTAFSTLSQLVGIMMLSAGHAMHLLGQG